MTPDELETARAAFARVKAEVEGLPRNTNLHGAISTIWNAADAGEKQIALTLKQLEIGA